MLIEKKQIIEDGDLSLLKTTRSETDFDWVEITYMLNGQLHSPSDPAWQIIVDDKVQVEEWCLHGVRTRNRGAAYTEVKEDGSKITMYYVDGKIHRENGSAVTREYPDGSVEKWEYHQNNLISYVFEDEDGTLLERHSQ